MIKKTGFELEQLVANGIHKRLGLLPDYASRQRVLAAVAAYLANPVPRVETSGYLQEVVPAGFATQNLHLGPNGK